MLTQLDPENVKTVSDLQSERQDSIDVDFDDEGGDDQEHENEAEDEDVVDDEDTYEDGSNDADSDDDESNFEEDGVKGSVQPSNDQIQATSSHSPQLSSTRRASIAQLRERLHNKIQMLHHKRQSQKTDGTEEPSTKQELLEARRRQRGEMRDNRRRERKEARRQAKANASANAKTSNDAKSSATSGGSSRSAGLLVEDPSTSSSATDYAGMPLDGKLSFSQVSFETRNAPDTARKNKYALPSDPKAALAALEARKRKEEAKIQKQIERGQDASQAREAANEAERWGKAMAASEGVRIRDNVHVLKQTLKRRERSKEKSAKSWYVFIFFSFVSSRILANPEGMRGAKQSKRRKQRNKSEEWRISPLVAKLKRRVASLTSLYVHLAEHAQVLRVALARFLVDIASRHQVHPVVAAVSPHVHRNDSCIFGRLCIVSLPTYTVSTFTSS